MRPHSAWDVTAQQWRLFRAVSQVLRNLPRTLKGPAFLFSHELPYATSVFIPNCHVVARAIATFFPFSVHDGFLVELRPDGRRRDHEHSWLVQEGGPPDLIYDVWPIGALSGPLLTKNGYGFFYQGEFCALWPRSDAEFIRKQEVLEKAIRAILEKNTRLHSLIRT